MIIAYLSQMRVICLRQLFFTLNRRRTATTKHIVNFNAESSLVVFHAICYIFPHSQYCQRLSVSLKGCYSIVTNPWLRLSAFLLHPIMFVTEDTRFYQHKIAQFTRRGVFGPCGSSFNSAFSDLSYHPLSCKFANSSLY